MSLTVEQYYEFITPNKDFKNTYSLTDITECVMRDGVAWTGTIRSNGVPVGSVECHGDGGCYSYWFENAVERQLFDAAVHFAYEGRQMIDVDPDCFINYLDEINK